MTGSIWPDRAVWRQAERAARDPSRAGGFRQRQCLPATGRQGPGRPRRQHGRNRPCCLATIIGLRPVSPKGQDPAMPARPDKAGNRCLPAAETDDPPGPALARLDTPLPQPLAVWCPACQPGCSWPPTGIDPQAGSPPACSRQPGRQGSNHHPDRSPSAKPQARAHPAALGTGPSAHICLCRGVRPA